MILSIAKQQSCNDKCFCKPVTGGDYLILSGSCFFNNNDNCEGLCAGDLKIPIESHQCFKFCLDQFGSKIIDPNEISIIKVENNKSLWWREIGDYCQRPSVLKYKLVVDITSANLSSNKINFNTNIKLVPDTTYLEVTWNNYGSSIFYTGSTNWSAIPYTWNQLSALGLNTLNCYPTIELLNQDKNLCFDIGQTSGEQEYTYTLTNGKYAYNMTLKYAYNQISQVFDLTLTALSVTGQYFTQDFVIKELVSQNTISGDNLSVHEELFLFTNEAVEYKSLNSFLFLSSLYKSSKIEIFNQDIEKKCAEAVQFS